MNVKIICLWSYVDSAKVSVPRVSPDRELLTYGLAKFVVETLIIMLEGGVTHET